MATRFGCASRLSAVSGGTPARSVAPSRRSSIIVVPDWRLSCVTISCGSLRRMTVSNQGHGPGIAMRDLLERVRRALQGRYDVKQEIGRGGAATVFLAEDCRHGRPVALKVLHP